MISPVVEGRCLRDAIARPVASRTPAATMKAGIVPDGIGETATPPGNGRTAPSPISTDSGPHIGSPAAFDGPRFCAGQRFRRGRALCELAVKAVEEPGRIFVANRPASANNRACAGFERSRVQGSRRLHR